MPDWQRQLLTDPQTSGGLLVACAAGRAPTRWLADDQAAGYPLARRIGARRGWARRGCVISA